MLTYLLSSQTLALSSSDLSSLSICSPDSFGNGFTKSKMSFVNHDEAVVMDESPIQENNLAESSCITDKLPSDLRPELDSGRMHSEGMEPEGEMTENREKGAMQGRLVKSKSVGGEKLEPPEDITDNVSCIQLELPPEDASITLLLEPGRMESERMNPESEMIENVEKGAMPDRTRTMKSESVGGETVEPPEDITDNVSSIRQELPPEDASITLLFEPGRMNSKRMDPESETIENIEKGAMPDSAVGSESVGGEKMGPPEDLTENASCMHSGLPSKDINIISLAELDPGRMYSEQMEPEGEMTENVGKGAMQDREIKSEYVGGEKLGLRDDLTCNVSCIQSGLPPEDANITSLAESVSGKNSSSKESMPEPKCTFGTTNGGGMQLELNQKNRANTIQNGPVESRTTSHDCRDIEQLKLSPEEHNRSSYSDPSKPSPDELGMTYSPDQLKLLPENVAMNSKAGEFKETPADMSKNSVVQPFIPAQEGQVKSPSHLGEGKGTSLLPRKQKSVSKSLAGSTRVLRSRLQEKSKAPEPSHNLEQCGNSTENRRKRRKHKKALPVNEFLRIRKHLRYWLQRMKYEQILIDAYSGEGWKGQSLEKIKPEKELQRAKSEILRRKLKIRDLFQCLDMSCAEGRLPESLFDSDGQIDSEDIFCAKCGSKDLSTNNDIILCDGACERAFHQFCLEPPLLKEDIPPDDEGWLCPGCDCKLDCIKLLNDYLETKLSITDSWEKVFPEAAEVSGNKLDDNFGLPSDDSEDDTYEPAVEKVDDGIQGDELSSDESDCLSASEGLEASPNNEQYLGLSSDETEDDDYDPNAPDIDEQVKPESSSSDFTSDSEDFSLAFDESGKNQGPMSLSSEDMRHCTGGEKLDLGGKKISSLHGELLYLMKSNNAQGDSASLSGKRHLERLDYKKLYDDTYGNTSSDSSDEDYEEMTPPMKRKYDLRKVVTMSPSVGVSFSEKKKDAKDTTSEQKDIGRTPRRCIRKKLDVEGESTSQAKLHKYSSRRSPSGKGVTGPPYKKLGEAVTKRLFASFKEDKYPTREVKENFAKELGLTVQQVSKWFENARWSFKHSSPVKSSTPEGAIKGTSLSTVKKRLAEPEQVVVKKNAICNGAEKKELTGASASKVENHSNDAKAANLVTKKQNGQKSEGPKSRKRKGKSDHEASNSISSMESPAKQIAPVHSPQAQQLRRSGRIRSLSEKPVG